MAKYLIPIDRTTVRKNPRAGRSDYTITLGPPRWSKTVVETKSYVRHDEKSDWMLVASDTKENISVSQPTQTLWSLSPEGQWLYEYEPVKVKCGNCRAEFLNTELKEDYNDSVDVDSYVDAYVSNVCPKCNAWECCQLEYEKIEDIVKEKYGE